MKLVVTIPAYNEEKEIANVIQGVPKSIPGVSSIKIVVSDDCSTDKTVAVAKKAGANYVVTHKKNNGLAKNFHDGIEMALELGADVIVNLDGDMQHSPKEIPMIAKPVIEGKADLVTGSRAFKSLSHMIPIKKIGNIVGSKVVSHFAGQEIKDVSCGFRAYSKEAALRLIVLGKHTYTHETLIQAANKNLRIVELPISVRGRTGKSKLIKTVRSHITKSLNTIMRTTLMYNALKTFITIGSILIVFGLIPIIRWIILGFFIQDGGNHIQSLIIGILFVIFGGLSILLGLVADLIALNRKIQEETLYQVRKQRFK